MSEKKFKGFITFYINFFPDLGQDINTIFKMIVDHNKDVIDRIRTDGEYEVMFVPTTKEATRVEKVDFDRPFPRFRPYSKTQTKDDEVKND